MQAADVDNQPSEKLFTITSENFSIFLPLPSLFFTSFFSSDLL